MKTDPADQTAANERSQPFETILESLMRNEMEIAIDPQGEGVTTLIRRPSMTYAVKMAITRETRVLQIYVNCPVLVVDPESRTHAAEFFTRVNWDMVLGYFEFDLRDGEARFHVSQLLPDRTLSTETFEDLLGHAMANAERYYPALLRVVYSGSSVTDAIFLAEVDLESGIAANGSAQNRAESGTPGERSRRRKRKTKGGETGADGSSTGEPPVGGE